MWLDRLLRDIPVDAPQVINDSKTPSGRVHVGSLRGVLIHDAVLRALRERDTPVVFRYGVDDYDPMDGLPQDAPEDLKRRMGEPLCALPGDPNPAERDINEFLDLFGPLGVDAEVYRTSAMYRDGVFNDAIAAILDAAEVVREVYERVGGTKRPDDWIPFQTICGRCGKIGTTRVTAWDGAQVRYRCEPELVQWARGCGHEDRISPFDGTGKLPWKLEWAAKWFVLGVTIEGAGKDHCTKGGARDVAAACLRRIFKTEPPLNIPYEFFLVGGSKMSSSRGIGAAARDMADFLPADALRFLMLRSPPSKTVNFSTESDYISRLFNEYDDVVRDALADAPDSEKERIVRLSSPAGTPPATQLPPFQLLVALVQLPHIRIEDEIARRSGANLSASDRESLLERVAAARYWLERFAAPGEKTVLCEDLPASAATLGAAQKAFLRILADALPEDGEDEHKLQMRIFDAARTTPLPAKAAFAAIYRVLFDSAHGPRGGAALAWIDGDFLRKRFREPPLRVEDWWRETAVTADDVPAWLEKNADAEHAVEARLHHVAEARLYAVELDAFDGRGKKHRVRVLLKAKKADDADGETAAILDRVKRPGFRVETARS